LSCSLALANLAAPSLPSHKQAVCLAKNIYHESRGEPVKGQLLVAATTLNRVASAEFPSTICKVVYQKGQFAWTKKPKPITESDAWYKALKLSYQVLAGKHQLNNQVLYFHHKASRPFSRMAVVPLKRVGNHIFYTLA
jgi:N-acetylmuramoyl-L-alanine amidase